MASFSALRSARDGLELGAAAAAVGARGARRGYRAGVQQEEEREREECQQSTYKHSVTREREPDHRGKPDFHSTPVPGVRPGPWPSGKSIAPRRPGLKSRATHGRPFPGLKPGSWGKVPEGRSSVARDFNPGQATIPSVMSAAVYLDHNATTPLHPRAREAMLPWLGGGSHGNPSSVHRFGQAAREAVEGAREQVAALLGVRPPEVVFTASGTEANNAVLFHTARKAGGMGHLVISAIEHPSIREAAARLAEEGLEVTRVSPRGDGVVPTEEVVRALRPDTRLVALMLANNELGTLQPVAEVAAACHERGIPVLCDAVQAVGKIPVDAPSLGVDYLVLGAHKFYGPLGAAAVWTRQGAAPPISSAAARSGGGGRGPRTCRRSWAWARPRRRPARRCRAAPPISPPCATASRRRCRRACPGAVLHCQASPRLPNTSHVAFEGVEGESLLIRLDLAGFAVSTGSACSSGSVEPSKTLLAAGISREEALASLRVSFGIGNTLEEVDAFLDALAREVAELRRAVA